MNLFKQLIEWAFFKYCYEPVIEIPEGYEVEFEELEFDESELTLLSDIERMSDELRELLTPTFDNEIEKAMYERRFHTLH